MKRLVDAILGNGANGTFFIVLPRIQNPISMPSTRDSYEFKPAKTRKNTEAEIIERIYPVTKIRTRRAPAIAHYP